jgi:transposase
MRYLELTKREKEQINHLYKTSPNHVVRQRCLCILYSTQGHSMKEISRITQISWWSIVRLFNAWEEATENDKFSVLSIKEGRGAKKKLEPVASLLPELVEQHNRNLKPILNTLEEKHSIKTCKSTLRTFLKETGL